MQFKLILAFGAAAVLSTTGAVFADDAGTVSTMTNAAAQPTETTGGVLQRELTTPFQKDSGVEYRRNDHPAGGRGPGSQSGPSNAGKPDGGGSDGSDGSGSDDNDGSDGGGAID